MKTLITAALLLLTTSAFAQNENQPTLRWFKGNTHTHTTNSDGDSSPGVVARWYRDNDYDFLVLSDHNKYTETEQLQKEISEENAAAGRKPFLLIPGEEVSDGFKDGDKNHALHINGIETKGVVGKQGGGSVVEVLQNCVDAIHAKGGVPHVNHPNFMWSLGPDDIFALRGLRHFEIYNGHPHVHNLGGGGIPGAEMIWDILLSRGRLFYGVAVDDAHNFKKFDRSLSNPGRGWIVVRAPQLVGRDIVSAFENGNYYASTGAMLDDITTEPKKLSLVIKGMRDTKFRTEFIGKDGKVLSTDETTAPAYRMRDDDLYVRARVTSSAGDYAWTQPLFSEAALKSEINLKP